MAVRVEAVSVAVVVTVDRPETKNAIDRATALAIGDAVRAASADPTCRGVVLAATGADVYLSGGDLNELAALPPGAPGAEAVLAMVEPLAILEGGDLPVIAAVQGDVYGGGCELMLLCDLVVVEERAGIAFRHAKMGLSPAWGGLTRLVERVGPLEAARLLYTAERIDAAEARRIGLVSEVVPAGAAQGRAIARIERIAENPRGAVARMKRTLREVREARRGAALQLEQAAFTERWGGADHEAAMRAFAARTKR